MVLARQRGRQPSVEQSGKARASLSATLRLERAVIALSLHDSPNGFHLATPGTHAEESPCQHRTSLLQYRNVLLVRATQGDLAAWSARHGRVQLCSEPSH